MYCNVDMAVLIKFPYCKYMQSNVNLPHFVMIILLSAVENAVK